ncbi:hypothetical protein EXE43_08215 [Halorubrum sp. SS5]|nr:hypothetical protein EXE43_08215 [Halorubrum sp. SS5]
MAFNPDELPVVMLFRGKTLSGLMRKITESNNIPSEWFRAKELDVSSTAFGRVRDQAVAYGLLEPSTDDDSARMPRYRIPESPTVQLLRSFHNEYDPSEDPDVSDEVDSVVLPDLMESDGRARLIGWFLAAAEIEEQYSISKIADVAPVGHTTVRDHIETLVDYGIVMTHQQSRGSQTYTTYQFNCESTVAAVLYDINETAANQRQQYKER